MMPFDGFFQRANIFQRLAHLEGQHATGIDVKHVQHGDAAKCSVPDPKINTSTRFAVQVGLRIVLATSVLSEAFSAMTGLVVSRMTMVCPFSLNRHSQVVVLDTHPSHQIVRKIERRPRGVGYDNFTQTASLLFGSLFREA